MQKLNVEYFDMFFWNVILFYKRSWLNNIHGLIYGLNRETLVVAIFVVKQNETLSTQIYIEPIIFKPQFQDEDDDQCPGDDQDQVAEYWSNQCQKYEERIVELHSVIAELSRKLEDTNDVIREESEFEETSVVTDSCLEEEEEEDDHDEPVITSSNY